MSEIHNPWKITFVNNEGRQHTHTRCGSTRRNNVVNSPRLVSEITNPCGRCSGRGYAEANPTSILDAWKAATHQQRFNPYQTNAGLQEFARYAQEQAIKMRDRWFAEVS